MNNVIEYIMEAIKRIKRDLAIIRYRKLPLIAYDRAINADVAYFPLHYTCFWIKLQEHSAKKLVAELVKLLGLLNYKSLIFMNAANEPWSSEVLSGKKDDKRLAKAFEYFKSIKLHTKFNGGVEVPGNDCETFLSHFYCVTVRDSSFYEYHFTDEKERVVFYLHYSGQLKICTLTREAHTGFLKAIKQTLFVKIKKQV